ncbi:MAG: glycosyltransferase family 9 protein [Deltaproteobacteria bacterium]|nr:glycosyltransferase family 9 protein [Deltaproteobacteria bacterium]
MQENHFKQEDARKRILIIRPGALGDTLMLAPSIATMGGSTDLVLVGRSPGIGVFKTLPGVRFCLDYEGQGWHTLFNNDPEDLPLLSVKEIELAVAFLSDPEGRARESLSILLPRTKIHLYPPFPPKEESVHTALYLAQCLQHAGAPLHPQAALEEASRRALLKREEKGGRTETVLFHPGSGSLSKNHPPRYWLDLTQKLASLFGPDHEIQCLLGEAESALMPFFRQNGFEGRLIFSPRLPDLISLLERAFLYIGHDSGVTHLAALLGTPTIALFKETSPLQWKPLGPRVRVIKGREHGPALTRRILQAASDLLGCPPDPASLTLTCH